MGAAGRPLPAGPGVSSAPPTADRKWIRPSAPRSTPPPPPPPTPPHGAAGKWSGAARPLRGASAERRRCGARLPPGRGEWHGPTAALRAERSGTGSPAPAGVCVGGWRTERTGPAEPARAGGGRQPPPEGRAPGLPLPRAPLGARLRLADGRSHPSRPRPRPRLLRLPGPQSRSPPRRGRRPPAPAPPPPALTMVSSLVTAVSMLNS